MFLISKRLDGETAAFEYYLGTDAEAYTLGEALVMSASGRLTKCGATATPEFICMRTQTEATAATPLPVIRINEAMEFETTSTATVASTLVGSKVTIDSTGLLCTATTTSGVFQVNYTDGATTNSKVRGMFRR